MLIREAFWLNLFWDLTVTPEQKIIRDFASWAAVQTVHSYFMLVWPQKKIATSPSKDKCYSPRPSSRRNSSAIQVEVSPAGAAGNSAMHLAVENFIKSSWASLIFHSEYCSSTGAATTESARSTENVGITPMFVCPRLTRWKNLDSKPRSRAFARQVKRETQCTFFCVHVPFRMTVQQFQIYFDICLGFLIN